MKKATLTLIACMLIVTALEGCQTTPEQPIVIQKDMEQMIEKAQEQAEAVPQTEQLAEKLGAPERYTAEYAYSDRFTMTADAKIILPNVTALPTVRVKPADFSQEMVNQLYAYLVLTSLKGRKKRGKTAECIFKFGKIILGTKS